GLESQSVSISPEQKADETNITATEKKQVSLVTEEQEAEKTKIVVIDEQQPVSTISEETETTAITSSVDEQQVASITETETKLESAVETQYVPISIEQSEDEVKIVSIQQQVSPVTDVGNEDATNLESAVET
ncbi:unnamed protein product, partial [Rotaria magnacalcarata]